MKPLVSILIPAYNAEQTIGYTLESAIAQTWPRKEIIVTDDGSTDRTAEIVRRFASKGVALVSTENGGLSAAVNNAYRLSQGDYIQELDADDLLAPDKIERQLAALRDGDSKRMLLSSSWAYFYYRTKSARFVRNSLWQDLSPVEWLLRKMCEGAHMQNATWLVSRELVETAGSWDAHLQYDQDGEYFARVVSKSEGIRFVPEARMYYRASSSNRISYIGTSNSKKDSLFRSMKMHMQHIRGLEDSERVRKACLAYMQIWYDVFYPDRPDIIEALQGLAAELRGHLDVPRLRWKYAWMVPMFGWNAAKRAQTVLPEARSSLKRRWDKAMFRLETSQGGDSPIGKSVRVSQTK
jgi:glycosyltransferase involved in cell wall biosynthesis